ncbi:MAG: hypothetical protein F6J97_16380 [Leptolyngbya sp. SIO4C1]|nr:hypothetical protein [Leptolyngbya sp. SIO4C1]
MRAKIENQVLLIHPDDVPHYKKKGSVVRNSYFWALRSIADRAGFEKPWEFDEVVWPALMRMLTAFAESGYLGYHETLLEFDPADLIPPALKPVATWRADDEEE